MTVCDRFERSSHPRSVTQRVEPDRCRRKRCRHGKASSCQENPQRCRDLQPPSERHGNSSIAAAHRPRGGTILAVTPSRWWPSASSGTNRPRRSSTSLAILACIARATPWRTHTRGRRHRSCCGEDAHPRHDRRRPFTALRRRAPRRRHHARRASVRKRRTLRLGDRRRPRHRSQNLAGRRCQRWASRKCWLETCCQTGCVVFTR